MMIYVIGKRAGDGQNKAEYNPAIFNISCQFQYIFPPKTLSPHPSYLPTFFNIMIIYYLLPTIPNDSKIEAAEHFPQC